MVTNFDLWQRTQSIEFDKLDSVFPFSKRLARDNGWSHAYALKAIEEYRKFAYLAVTTGREVTPSDEVDQVWHLHLTYTRHYWGTFQETLGMPLHHGPTAGGAEEAKRYALNYEATLQAYEAEFGEVPKDIWPDAQSRFSDPLHFRRVNLNNKILLPKWIASIAAGVPILGGFALLSSAFANSSGNAGGTYSAFSVDSEILAFIGVAALFIGFISFLVIKSGKGQGKGDGSAGGAGYDAAKHGDGGDGGGSGCGSGCGGCGGA